LLRRVLLGATVALLTARMLAPGEDPGLLENTSGPTDLLLPLFWLLTALGLTAWRLWSGKGDWRGGVAEAALLVAAVLAVAGTEWAGYRHPARIIAWDWVVLLVVVVLVRQLALSPEDQRALFAVFLAGAGCLAGQAVWQGAVQFVPASASFAQPGPFLAWLALFLPGLFIAHIVCHFRRAVWMTIATGLFTIFAASAVGLAVVSARGSAAAEPPLTELWGATWRMIQDRPFGVGLGSFSRALPRYQEPGAPLAVADPRNFLLEIAATGGVVLLLAVLTALGAFFFRAVRWLVQKSPKGFEAEPPAIGERVCWEFYIGGMVGLVFGFFLRMATGDHTQEEILREGGFACARCLVWLAAFTLYERVPWSARLRVLALVLGVAASLAVLCVTGGIGLPSVNVPLGAAVALALNALRHPTFAAANQLRLTRILPFAAAAAVLLVYFLEIFIPVADASYYVQGAALEARKFNDAIAGKNATLLDRLRKEKHGEYIKKNILEPLVEAAKYDPDDARIKVMQSRWTLELWADRAGDRDTTAVAVAFAAQAEKLDPRGRDGYQAEYAARMAFGKRMEFFSGLPGAALGPGYRVFLAEARWPNPLGRDAIETAKRRYREAVAAKQKEGINPYEPAVQYLEAAAVLEKYLPNAPNDPELRYLWAEALFKAWEDDRCAEQAAEALRLDKAAARPPLTDEQRRKLNLWKDLPAVKR
jgi:hypothetical protein